MKTYKEFLKESENQLQIDEDLVTSASKTLNTKNQLPIDNTDKEPENIVKKPKSVKPEEPLTNIDDIDKEEKEDNIEDDSNIDLPSFDDEDSDNEDNVDDDEEE